MHLLKAIALGLLVPAAASAQGVDPAYPHITGVNALVAEDELAVRQVIARMNQALDTHDYNLYASFYASDAVFTSRFGDAEGRDAIEAVMEMARPLIMNKRHVSGNLIINGSGDTAVVKSYLTVFEREADLSFVGSAINVDTLKKRDGKWVVVLHESTLDPATERATIAAISAQE